MVHLLSSIYNGIVGTVDKIVPNNLRPLWMSAAGPKTVFFWAPIFKWGLVFASLGDLKRPAETISINQCTSLAITGVIWSRYSVVIIPKNYILLAVNVFVALTNGAQALRAVHYKMQQAKSKE